MTDNEEGTKVTDKTTMSKSMLRGIGLVFFAFSIALIGVEFKDSNSFLFYGSLGVVILLSIGAMNNFFACMPKES